MKNKWILVVVLMLINNGVRAETLCGENEIVHPRGKDHNGKSCVLISGSCNWYTSNCEFEMDDNFNVKVSATKGKTTTIKAWGYFYRINVPIKNFVIDETVTSVDFSGTEFQNVYCKKGTTICNNQLTRAPIYPYELDEKTGQIVVYNMTDDSIRAVYDDWNDLYKDEVTSSYEKYDEVTKTLTKYDGRGKLLSSKTQNEDGSFYTYDGSGKIIGISGKKIYTVEEATIVAKKGAKNTFKIKYR